MLRPNPFDEVRDGGARPRAGIAAELDATLESVAKVVVLIGES